MTLIIINNKTLRNSRGNFFWIRLNRFFLENQDLEIPFTGKDKHLCHMTKISLNLS